jgi:amino acid transporter
MHNSKKPIGFWSAVSMGIGAMVGAGIFALLGEASAIAGSAVYISFIIGGIIALFSGYSMGKLGARYPSSGGIIEYLSQAYGVGIFTGTMGIMLYFSAIFSLSLIAKAFGNYAVTFLPADVGVDVWRHVFSTGIIILFVLINLKGAKNVAVWERITVGVKFVVLVGFSIAGIIFLKPALLSPSHYPPTNAIFFSLAITFFAFEGFRVITNTAEDMPNPSKTLPQAIITAVAIVIVLYVAIAFAVFGNLPVEKIIAAKDFALAEAALPVFGQVGFTIVAMTALVATASAINANLYAVTNVTYQLAKDGELPAQFGKPIAHSREGLIVSGILIIVLSLLFDLSEIATIGSISILFIHTVTHIGHLKIASKTGASKILVLSAAILCFCAMILSLVYVSHISGHVMYVLVGFILVALITEMTLQKTIKKETKPRVNPLDRSDPYT